MRLFLSEQSSFGLSMVFSLVNMLFKKVAVQWTSKHIVWIGLRYLFSLTQCCHQTFFTYKVRGSQIIDNIYAKIRQAKSAAGK